ncbi:adenylate kinase 9 [Bombina bombina]|uniref:adenylate kinase 9 n=1 Tax=Bombina bombina TaxID=8345 RepID=UPI00235A9878|nr:adenylate kinase 9 [Bombina bombina]
MAQQKKIQLEPFADTLNEDETESAFLLSKPVCFLIIGKPGTGKATLGKKLSQAWKCLFIEAKELIIEHIERETEYGNKIQELLYEGQSIPEQLITQLIIEKINSPEAAHLGYVLCGFPSLSEEYAKIPEQIALIKSFKLQPDVIINIKCPDKDLCKRLSGQKQDPETGHIYQHEDWNLAVKEQKKNLQRDEEEEEEEEEMEEEEEDKQDIKEVLQHLVIRPEDFPENADERIRLYKDILLRPLEDLMIDHNPQYLIELDGNKKTDELFSFVFPRLESLGLRHGSVVMKLQNSEEEDTVEGMEGEDLFRALSSCRLIAPRYRWRRSRWGQLCPVSLKEGYFKKGLAEFAVSFLDKMYLLSSEEALRKFIQNPRPYLLPPMPIAPCKVAVVGPRFSGKTTLSLSIAAKYSGKVFDMSELIIPYVEEAKQTAIDKAREEATEAAIKTVKVKLEQERMLKKQEEFSNEAEESSPTQPNEEATTEEVTSVTDKSVEMEKLEEPLDEKEILATTDLVEEVDANHPEVQEIVFEAIKIASQAPVTPSPHMYAAALENAINKFYEQSKERFPGAPPEGGWVINNLPNSTNNWIALAEKGLLPDTVLCLGDSADNGKCLLARLYQMNKQDINNNILQRLQKEKARRLQEEEEARKEQQETMKLQQEQKGKEESEQEVEDREDKPEGSDDQLPLETQLINPPQLVSLNEVSETSQSEQEPDLEPKAKTETDILLPEIPEGEYPDVPEMDPVRQFISTFKEEWQLLEPMLRDTYLVNVSSLEIANRSPEALLKESQEIMEKSLKYHGRKQSSEDIDEELEDVQAEMEAEEQEEGEEEEATEAEENEDDEDAIHEKKRQYGDSKHYCPVALKDDFILHPGKPDNAAIYRERIYYCSSTEARDKFLANPEKYTAHEEPLHAPPLRVFLLGASGAGKTDSARWLADKLGIFHIQFQERLQEIILAKLQKKVGPKYEDASEENQEEEAIDDSAQEENASTKEKVILTVEEEAVKSYLVDGEPLPLELLDQIVTELWTQEPFRSTGFIFDGFPSTLDEVNYIAERGFFPDIAVFLEVKENDVCDRLLPPRLSRWKEKQTIKQDRKQKSKELKKKLRDEEIAKRRAELVAEQERMIAEKVQKKDADASDEEEEEEEEVDNIELILSEEFPEDDEDDDEDEEQEEDAIERMKTEIGEKYEGEVESLESVQEEVASLMIPCITVNGGRKSHIVHYQIYDKIKHLVEDRKGLFEKCYPVSSVLASKMLHLSYKHLSVFGRWDPVKLSQGEVIKPFQTLGSPDFPLIYRQYIYFFTTKENRESFMKNPIKYICQSKPKPSVPIRTAIVGPPKSGKTTVANMVANVYGLQRLSIGDAIRSVLENQPQTELATDINRFILKGLVVPDELAVKCLEVALMDLKCITTGVVLDGYPATKQQVDLMEACSVIPIKIFELQLDMKEVLKRGLMDKKNSKRTYPEHNSAQILAVRNSCYKQQIHLIKEHYTKLHQNWCEIDSMHSKWWVVNKVIGEIKSCVMKIQDYVERIQEGKAAGIADFCITPQELLSRLGEFGQYCPVSLAQKGELVDCSVTSSLQFAAEFRGHYYKMASQNELNAFLEAAELYVPPLAPHPLPPPEMLPKKLTVGDVKSKFPRNAEMRGYCSVTYLDGKKRYEALVPGHIENAVEYKEKIYFFENEEKLQKFMRLPEKYWNQELPRKLPPKKEPILLTSLPLTGYLEQGAATALIKALNDVGALKPKYPFLSVKRSALLYIAYHLKAYNHRNSDYVRKKYKKKLDQFVDHCELITYLGDKMTRKYKEPQRRPVDFDYKMQSFLSLKNVNPTCS